MARRRNIYDASYQTPLADFLDQLPEYFLKYEQLKQQNKKYDNEQAYRAARDKESDRRWDATQQEKIKNQRLNTAKVQLTQQLNDANSIPMGSRKDWIGNIRHQYNDFPELLSIIDSRVSSLDPYVKADEKYRIIDADLSELDTLSTDESFGSHFNREEKRNELYASTANLAEGSGTKAMIDNQIAVLDKTLKFEKDNAGKRKPDSDWSREDLEEFNRASNLVTSGNTRAVNIQDEIRKKQAQLDSLGKDVGDITPAVALRKEIAGLTNDYYSLISYEDNEGSVVRGSIDKNREIMKILESRNSFPKLEGTPEILEGGVSGYEPKVEMKEQDVERYILNNPEQGFDAWMDFITNPNEESENKFSSMLNEFVESENAPPPPPPKQKVELPDTVKDALAVVDKKRQGVNLAESGDETVPDKESDKKETKIPAILGGLKAQGKDKDQVKVEDKKDIIPISKELKIEKPKGKYGSAGGALSDVYDKMVKVRKLEDSSKYTLDSKGGKQSYQNALKTSEKLREQLKKDILSIYNPETREFRYPGYAETFSPKGDVAMSWGKPKQLDTRNVAGGWSGRREIPVGDIMSFIEELFPPQIASN